MKTIFLTIISSNRGFQQRRKGVSLGVGGKAIKLLFRVQLEMFLKGITKYSCVEYRDSAIQDSQFLTTLHPFVPWQTAESDSARLPSLSKWSHSPSISTHSHHCHLKNSSRKSGTKPSLHFPHKFHILEAYVRYKICGNFWSSTKAMNKFQSSKSKRSSCLNKDREKKKKKRRKLRVWNLQKIEWLSE